MRLIFLGTSSGSPTLTRNVSSLVLQFDDNRIWLFDCGEGTQREFLKYNDIINLGMIDVIFITHLHGDHVYGLFGMLCSLALFTRTTPLDVIGPKGIKDLINSVGLHTDMKINYPLNIFELNYDSATVLFPRKSTPSASVLYHLPQKQIPVVAYPLPHVIRSYGFFITCPQAHYTFSEKKAISLGVPYGQLWEYLRNQTDVVFPSYTPSPSAASTPSSSSTAITSSLSPPASSFKASVLNASSVAFVPKGKIGLGSGSSPATASQFSPTSTSTSSSTAASVHTSSPVPGTSAPSSTSASTSTSTFTSSPSTAPASTPTSTPAPASASSSVSASILAMPTTAPPLIGVTPVSMNQSQMIKVRWKDVFEWVPHRLLICGDCGPGYIDYVGSEGTGTNTGTGTGIGSSGGSGSGSGSWRYIGSSSGSGSSSGIEGTGGGGGNAGTGAGVGVSVGGEKARADDGSRSEDEKGVVGNNSSGSGGGDTGTTKTTTTTSSSSSSFTSSTTTTTFTSSLSSSPSSSSSSPFPTSVSSPTHSSSSSSSSSSILRSPEEGKGVGSPTDWLKLFAGVQEVDTLVHESTYATRDKWKAEKWGHSSAGEAGDHAKILKAKTLLLNHFSIRYFSQDERGILELLRDAQLTCSPGTNVIAAYDGFVFELY